MNFKYNNILQKGNYLFKFAGVLEESTYENIQNYSDSMKWNYINEKLTKEYINAYDARRNLNIIGKASLIQINILEDIQVFCNKEYNDKCLKSNDNKCLTEIPQYLIGENYYYDFNVT